MLLWAVSLLAALLVYGQRQLSSPNGDLLRTTAPNFDASNVELLNEQNMPLVLLFMWERSLVATVKLTTPHQTQLLTKLGDFHQN